MTPIKKRQIAPKTGALSELTTFAEVWRAFDEQLSTALRLQAKADNIIERIHAEYAPSPFLSLMVSDCIDRGLPVEGVELDTTSPPLMPWVWLTWQTVWRRYESWFMTRNSFLWSL